MTAGGNKMPLGQRPAYSVTANFRIRSASSLDRGQARLQRQASAIFANTRCIRLGSR